MIQIAVQNGPNKGHSRVFGHDEILSTAYFLQQLTRFMMQLNDSEVVWALDDTLATPLERFVYEHAEDLVLSMAVDELENEIDAEALADAFLADVDPDALPTLPEANIEWFEDVDAIAA